MTIEGNKLKERIDRWQEYIDQPSAAPTRASDNEADSAMFSWSVSPSTGHSAGYDGNVTFDHPSSLTSRSHDSYATHGTDLEKSRTGSDLEASANAEQYRQRIVEFEAMLYQLQLELQSERQRADDLQMQLAREIMRSRQVKIERRARPPLLRLKVRNRIGGIRRSVLLLTGAKRSGNVLRRTMAKSRLNSVQWIVIVALTAGISSLLAAMVANGMIP